MEVGLDFLTGLPISVQQSLAEVQGFILVKWSVGDSCYSELVVFPFESFEFLHGLQRLLEWLGLVPDSRLDLF